MPTSEPPSHVFVLGTGRCGTSTFTHACEHISNFTVGHETRIKEIGPTRFAYPEHHIEADNKLSWFLGELGTRYGDDAHYVHLRRDPDATARSFLRRWGSGVIGGFAGGIVPGGPWNQDERLSICRFYVDTVNHNIEAFLSERQHCLRIDLETLPTGFARFWEWIGAEGDLSRAVATCHGVHNSSASSSRRLNPRSARRTVRSLIGRVRSTSGGRGATDAPNTDPNELAQR